MKEKMTHHHARNELWQEEIQSKLRRILEDDTFELERTSHLYGSVPGFLKLERFPELKVLGATIEYNEGLHRTDIFIPKPKPWIPVQSLVWLSRVMVAIVILGQGVRVVYAFMNR
jgi:hypothetical protein